MNAPAFTKTAWPHWTTPAFYLERVRWIGSIKLDPCGNGESNVGAWLEFRGEVRDGLELPWSPHPEKGLVYVNPPYGRELPKWAAKMAEEAGNGCEIIALLPARVDTTWMHDHVFGSADAGLFHRGRIQFDNPPPTGASSSTFPNFTAYWGRNLEAFAEAFGDLGQLVRFNRGQR